MIVPMPILMNIKNQQIVTYDYSKNNEYFLKKLLK